MNVRKLLATLTTLLAAAVFVMALVGCGAKDVNVTIDDNGTLTEVSIAEGKTVADALAAADIELGDKDVIEPSLDTKITQDTNKITIQRLVTVKVVDGSQTKDVELIGATVQDALTEAQIVLADGDIVDVELTAPLQNGMTIVVTRKQADVQSSDSLGASYSSDDDGSSSDAAVSEPAPARSVVSKTRGPNCDDESHGYYEILYSDGSMEYEEY